MFCSKGEICHAWIQHVTHSNGQLQCEVQQQPLELGPSLCVAIFAKYNMNSCIVEFHFTLNWHNVERLASSMFICDGSWLKTYMMCLQSYENTSMQMFINGDSTVWIRRSVNEVKIGHVYDKGVEACLLVQNRGMVVPNAAALYNLHQSTIYLNKYTKYSN